MATGQPLGPQNTPGENTGPLVKRGRVESIYLYEVKDTELDSLESGSTGDLYLNIAVFLFGLGFSAFTTIATADFRDKRMETAFVCLTVVCIVLTPIFGVLWYRSRRSIKRLCALIRRRIEDEVIITPVVVSDSGDRADDTEPGPNA